MSDKPENIKFFDPFEAWRSMAGVGMDAWAKAMVEAVNTDAYAKATGSILDGYLSASAPFREAVEKAAGQALRQLSMPTRDDFISLADRLTNIELRLDDLDAKLDASLAAPKPARAQAKPRIVRKKKGATSNG